MTGRRPLHGHPRPSLDAARRGRIVAATLSGALVVSASSVAHAYRPFDGTDADVAELGEFELELGSAYTDTRASFPQLTAPAVVLNLGFLPRFELVLESDNLIAQRTAGGVKDQLAETHAFVKALLRRGVAQEQTGPSIAVEAGPWLPNPNGEQGVGGSANFIFSVQIQQMMFHLNLQGAYDLERHVEFFGSLISEGPRSLLVRPVTELVAQHAFGGSTTYSALFGGIWRAHTSLDVDLAVRAAITDQVPMGEVRLGFTLRVPVWHARE